MYQTCRLVHADLSEYNILYHEDKPWIIDVSQSVEHDHPRSLEFLRMDVKNISDFFSRKGVDTLSERAVFGFVTAQEGSVEMDGMREVLEKLYQVREQEGEDEGEKEVDDEVFRQQYIPRTLREVYDIERDGEKILSGEGGELVYSDLLASKASDTNGDTAAEGESESGEKESSVAPSDGKKKAEREKPGYEIENMSRVLPGQLKYISLPKGRYWPVKLVRSGPLVCDPLPPWLAQVECQLTSP